MIIGSANAVYWGVLSAVAVIAVLLIIRMAVLYSGLSKLRKSLFERDAVKSSKLIKSLKAQALMPYRRASYDIMSAVLTYGIDGREACIKAFDSIKNKKSAYAKYYWLAVVELIDGNTEAAKKYVAEFENSPHKGRTGQSYEEYESRLNTFLKYKEENVGESDVKKTIGQMKEVNPLYADMLAKLLSQKPKGGKKE